MVSEIFKILQNHSGLRQSYIASRISALNSSAKKIPVVTLTSPRQSGKTTMVKLTKG